MLLAYAKITLTRRAASPRRCRTSLLRRRAARLLPDAAARAVRRPARPPPAAPRDHHDRCGQRHGQPRRHHLRLPRAGGDRREPGGDRPGLHRRARGLRLPRFCGERRGAGQRGAHRRRRPRCTSRAAGCSTARPAGCCRVAGGRVDVDAEIARFRAGSATDRAARARAAGGRRAGPAARAGRPSSSPWVPEDLALRAAAHCSTCSRCSTSSRSRPRRTAEADEVARIYFALSERFEVDKMLTRITEAAARRPVDGAGRASLRYDLYAALAA